MENRFVPEEIQDEILLKLPIKSLKRFTSVCKRWDSSVESPSFINRYNDQQANTNHNGGKFLCLRRDPDTKTTVVSLFDHRTHEKIEDLELPPFIDDGLERKGDEEFFDKYLKNHIFHRDIHMFGPINGVYCIYHRLIERWAGTLILWNPSTREYKHIVPEISFPFSPDLLAWHRYRNIYHDVSDPEGFLIGFGFDHRINDYKVVVICKWCRIYDFCTMVWHFRVYNHSSGSWRTLYSFAEHEVEEGSPFLDLEIDSYPEFTNCFLNGTYYWSCTTSELTTQGHKAQVLAFDMVEETYKVFQGPPISPSEYENRSVWALRETLIMVSSSTKNDKVEVWTMMESGVAVSWALHYTIEVGANKVLRPVGVTNVGKFYFGDNDGKLISYDMDDHQVEEHGIYGMECANLNITGRYKLYYGTPGVVNYVENLSPIRTVPVADGHVEL